MNRAPIGRDEELALIEAWIAGVPDGASALLIEADAGAGKTTVLHAAADLARRAGLRVLSAQPTEAEQALSFTALSDLLTMVADEVLDSLPEPQRIALELALLRRSDPGSAPDPRTIGVATLNTLRLLSQTQSLVLAIDDVQWIDTATRTALSFALRRMKDEAVGALLVQRATPATTSATPLGPPRSLQRLALKPLDGPAIRGVLARELAWEPSGETLRRLLDTSGGNPLFALEIGRAVQERDFLEPGEPLPVPAKLRHLVLARVRGLPASHRTVLLHAAALRTPTPAILHRAIGDAERVDRAIDAAEEASFLARRGSVLVFSHPMYSSVLYGSSRVSLRRQVHARLAALVTDREERARHLALAATGPDAGTAAELEHAAGIARARGAAAAAAELAELALGLTPVDDPVGASRRRLLAGRHRMEAQDLPAAQRLLDELETHEDVVAQVEASLLLARIAVRTTGPVASIALAEDALATLGREHEGLRARALTLLSSHLLNSDQPTARAIEVAETALAAARSVNDRRTESVAMMYSQLARTLGGKPIDPDERSLLPAPDSGAPTLYFAGLTFMAAGDLDGARQYLGAVLEHQDLIGDEFDRPPTMMLLADVEARAGNLAQGLALGRSSMQACIEADQTAMIPFSAAIVASALASRGQIDEARSVVAPWRAVGRRLPTAWAYLAGADGYTHLCAGDPASAVETLEPLYEFLEGIGMVEHAALPFRTDLVEALILTGATDRAEQILEVAEGRRSCFESFSRHCWLRCRELLHAARGETEQALDAGERAMSLAEGLPTRFAVVRTMLVHGGILRRVKRKRAARAMLEQTLDLFRSFGATLWAERAEAELRRVGVGPGSPSELTPTETRVAELVTKGMKNREIATALSISIKTVEANLARIYRKMSVETRLELARKTMTRAAQEKKSESIDRVEG